MATTAEEPQAILGTAGSRLRLVLGKNGFEFLAVASRDIGDETRYWNNVPNKIENAVCRLKSVTTDLDYGPTGAWYARGKEKKKSSQGGFDYWFGGSKLKEEIAKHATPVIKQPVQVSFGRRNGAESVVVIDKMNGDFMKNVDKLLKKRIRRLRSLDKDIHFVRLFDDGAYFISDEEGMSWGGLATDISEELARGSGPIHDVAYASDGSWIVIRDEHFESSEKISPYLDKLLNEFFREQKEFQLNRNREIREHREAILAEQERVRQEKINAERAEQERLQRIEEKRRRAELEEQRRAELEEQRRAELEEQRRAELEERERLEIARQEEERCRQERLLAEQVDWIRQDEERIMNRKRALNSALAEFPAEQRARICRGYDLSVKIDKPQCVICRDSDPDLQLCHVATSASASVS